MTRIVVTLVVTFAIAATLSSQTRAHANLGAPTYYIAANAELRDSHEIWLRGASNLPAGAALVVDVQNYVGEGSQTLGVRALPKVGKMVSLKPHSRLKRGWNLNTTLFA